MAIRAAIVAAGLAACSVNKTSRVDETLTPGTLAAAKKAVAVMRLGAASPSCINVSILLGTREGEGYRRGQAVMVANVRSLAEAQVAEVELEPGQHHVLGYKCDSANGATWIADVSTTNGLLRTSYAHFTLAPGEIVNVGYFHFGASHEGRSLFGRAVRSDIEITDWPLADLERFKRTRPAIYAQMTTRLMVLDGGPLTADEQQQACETHRRLQAEGKLQTLPPACGGSAPAKKIIHGNR